MDLSLLGVERISKVYMNKPDRKQVSQLFWIVDLTLAVGEDARVHQRGGRV